MHKGSPLSWEIDHWLSLCGMCAWGLPTKSCSILGKEVFSDKSPNQWIYYSVTCRGITDCKQQEKDLMAVLGGG